MKTWLVTFEQRVEHLECYSNVIKAETAEAAIAIIKQKHEDGELEPESSNWIETIETLEEEDFIAEEQ